MFDFYSILKVEFKLTYGAIQMFTQYKSIFAEYNNLLNILYLGEVSIYGISQERSRLFTFC